MNDELDYYDSLQPTDSQSLQEMIECDMRTQTYESSLGAGSDFGIGPAQHLADLDFAATDPPSSPSLSVRLDSLDGLDADLLGVGGEGLVWSVTGAGNGHTSIANGISPLDFDPIGILVNPQTGLPITVQLSSPQHTLLPPSHPVPPSQLLSSVSSASSTTSLSSSSSSSSSSSTNGDAFDGLHAYYLVNPAMVDEQPPDELIVSDFDDEDVFRKPNSQHNSKMDSAGKKSVRGRRQNNNHHPQPKGRLIVSRADELTDEDDGMEEDDEDDYERRELYIDDDEDEDEEEEEQEEGDEDEEEERVTDPKVLKKSKGLTPASCCKRKLNGRPSLAFETAQLDRIYPKPAYSYSCLIAMALKNSESGCLPVSEIYKFMIDNFPYFKTAPNGWKNSVRHNLSLNKCFEKIEKPGNGAQRKGCLWAMNPDKIGKMNEEVLKWSRKDPLAIKLSMARPENFEMLERGCLKPLQENRPTPAAPKAEKKPTMTPKTIIAKTIIAKPVPVVKEIKPEKVTLVAKIKAEPAVHDGICHEPTLYMDNSILDLNLQPGLWGDLEDKMDFDLPPTPDGFPPSQLTYLCAADASSENSDPTFGTGPKPDRGMLSRAFLSKQLRTLSTAM